MNYVINESKNICIAIGDKDSFARTKQIYNITLPKMISKLYQFFAYNVRPEINKELTMFLEDEKIEKEEHGKLIKAAFFYYENPHLDF